jgi:hypothetical protein
MGVMTDVNLCHRMNDQLDDQMKDGNLFVNRDLRMNDRLDDHSTDDDHRVVPVGHRMNGMDDPSLGVKMDVSRDLRRNDRLDDHSMDDDHRDVLVDHHMSGMDDRKTDGNHVNRNCVRRDLNLVVKMDVSRGLRMSDLLVGHLMDGSHVNRNCVRHDLSLDAMTDGNHVNRNYAPRDLMTDVNLGAMNHHVMLMDDRSKSCDRMSHVHLRYDRQMKRRRDMNRMDGMNLDGKMKIRRVSWC